MGLFAETERDLKELAAEFGLPAAAIEDELRRILRDRDSESESGVFVDFGPRLLEG